MATIFDVQDVEELLALMEQWGIAELHLTVDGASLDLTRATAGGPALEAVPAVGTTPVALMSEPEAVPEPPSVSINSPAVGTFHLRHNGFPHGSPRPGDQVQAGQIIGTIELMHIPSDIASPVSGVILDMLAEDGAGVEYGQPLMVIRPYEEVDEHEAGMLPPPPR